MVSVKSAYSVWITGILFILLFLACRQKDQYISPPGYDFANPKKFVLKNSLHEISGIAFLNKNADTLYAINDEAGKLYFFKPGDDKYANIKFGRKGDYEDVCFFNNDNVVVLRSDGSLYMFPLYLSERDISEHVKSIQGVLPKGEYEGLSREGEQLLVLCKNCPVDKKGNQVTVYAIDPTLDGAGPAGIFTINLRSIQERKNKMKFRPSALAKNPVTEEWYIISSINKMLVVLDAGWNYKKHYPLDPVLFKQPEGIAFAGNGDLYISNEGKMTSANILLFTYTAP